MTAGGLANSEGLLRAVCEGTPDPIYVKDSQGRIVWANPAMLRVIGKPAEGVLGMEVPQIFDGADAARVSRESDLRVLDSGQAEALEEVFRTPEGTRVFLCTKTPRRDAEGRVIGLLGVARDITQRKRMEDALRQREAGLAAAQRIAHLGNWEIAVTSVTPLVLDTLVWSEEVFRILGCDPSHTEASNESFLRAVHPEDRARFESHLREGLEHRQPWELEHRILRPDGAERVVHQRAELVCDAAGRPVKLVGTIQDTTGRKRDEEARQRLESQLRQAQKMEAVGQLAGGVAHDFNNMLTVILGNAELLAEGPPLEPERQELLRQISESGRRAANLTRQLLAFSRRQVMQVRPLDLNEVLANVYKMLRRLLGEHITLQCNYAPELPSIEADAGMMEQVLLNLAINGRDAMPQGGRLALTSAYECLDAAAARRNPEARAGRFVTLTVTDTGCGMDSATLARIFEPFFTTKDVGQGTGLGLATVYGIVKQHNGWLEVTSQPGLGSTFKSYFPVTAAAPAAAATSGSAPRVPRGHETVLLVEDEPSVRALAQVCLHHLGYRVLEAGSGPEALRIWQEHQKQIDLLLTDLVMPEGLSGRELGRQLRRTKPGFKVVYTSGYSRELIGADSELEPGERFLPKPYEVTTLARALRQCLDEI